MINEIKQPIFGNWYIEKEVGSGSFGTVYKIKRETFGKVQYAAMKVIRIPQDKSEKIRLMSEGMDEESITGYYDQFVKDFSKEIELMAELQGNTNIVGYTDHIIEENEDGIGYTIYIRMEYLIPLDKYLISENTVKEMSLQEVIKLGVDICRALEICATKNIIHRDIKPDNIFVSENGDFELGDFGIARQLESTQSGLSKKGTYTYMAPEIYNGQAYNSTVDIYSLGIVLYRLLNKNRAPFLPLAPAPIKYTDKENALISRMKGAPIPSIVGIDERINEIVLKACAYNPKERYRTASEMKAALLALDLDETNGNKISSGPIDEEDDDKTVSPFDEIINDVKDVIDELMDEEDDELESTVGPFDNRFKESSTDDEKLGEDSLDEENKDEYDETVGPFDKIKEDILNDIDKDDKNENKSNSSSNSEKKKLIAIPIIIFVVLIAILSVTSIINTYSNRDYNDDSNYVDDSVVDDSVVEDSVYADDSANTGHYQGQCGDNATFSIINTSDDPYNPYYELSIEGKGELWAADAIDWQIDGGKIKEIWVYDGITAIQKDQFSSGTFDSVVEIHFFDTVNYIGKSACDYIDTLKEVYVDSMDCKIDYEDNDGNIYGTLGNPNGSIKIICYEGSTAYDYVNTWNDNYANSYKIKLY